MTTSQDLQRIEQRLRTVGRRKLMIVVDDSSSLQRRGNAQTVRDGVNALLGDQAALPYADQIDVTIVLLNEQYALCTEVPIARVPRLAADNHAALATQTPLHRRSYSALKHIEAQLLAAGDDAVACVVIATDGADNVRTAISHRDVRRVAERLRATGRCLVAGIGVWDGETDFYAVFASMGIPREFVSAPAGTPQATAKGFDAVSVTFSQATGSFDDFSRTMHSGLHHTPAP